MKVEKTTWEKIDILFKILLPISFAYVGWISNQTAMQFDQQKYQQSVNEFQTTTQLKYLDYFLDNLQYKDSIHQSIALQLLPKIEPELAIAYTNILKKEISKEEKNSLSTIEESIEIFGELNQYKIGIYFLKQNEGFAGEIKEKLVADGFKGLITLNLREQDFFNQLAPPVTNEIRFEPSTEEAPANTLKDILKSQHPNINFETRPVKNRTPNFISLMLK